MSGFGYEYPAGAEEDPNAPWNDQVCDSCGFTFKPEDLNEEEICNDCVNGG